MKWSLSDLGFDSYERRARLYPSLIALFPAIAVALLLEPHAFFGSGGRLLVAAIAYVGLFYLLANIARTEGQRIEPQLLRLWGGWPSTILLRHSDRTIDPHTKTRYYRSLAKVAPGLAVPSAEMEEANSESADEIFRSLTKRLLEKRRGPKYQLVADSNAEYGFRRNMLGLKPWAITAATLIACLISFIWWLTYPTVPFSKRMLAADVGHRWKLYVLYLCDLGAISFWVFYVRESWVRLSAFDFAHALFRTLE